MEALFDISAEEAPIFLAEAEEQLQILDEGLIELEQREGENPDLLQALFRAAHTLKGSAGMINHHRMVDLTHSLEAVLDGVRKNALQVTPALVDACLSAVDALRLLCAEVATGQVNDIQIAPLVQNLVAVGNIQPGPPARRGVQPPAIVINAPPTRAPTAPMLLVEATISPDSIASAARAFQIMLALQEMGEIVQMSPTAAEIDTAAPVREFTAQIVPTRGKAEVRKALEAISDIDLLTLSEVDETGNPLQPPEAASPEDLLLGKLLVDNKLISEAQLQAGLSAKAQTPGPSGLLGQTLITLGFISQEVLDQIIAEQSSQKSSPEPKPGQPASERPRTRLSDKTVRTSVERLDNLMNLVGELITDRNRLYLIRSTLEAKQRGDEQVEALSDTITHIGRITDQLQMEVMGIRMLPMGNVFNKFPRMVRDLAHKAGKQIDLVIRGEETELDRSVIEEISDPLIHLIRNAVDHGLERPAERLAAGKPERGILLLTARHEQGRIIITVEDNGRGIDIGQVKAKAIEKGLLNKTEAQTLSDDETIDLIFASGLSTAKVVSDVSGRGVGMDIVRNNIERLNGSIAVDTWPGKGTKFQIILPLTLAIVPTLLVRASGNTYAIPLVTVTETLRTPVSAIKTVQRRPVIVLREQVVPVVRLSEVFNIAGGTNGHAQANHEFVVVVRFGRTQMGIIVDQLIGEEEVVVKSLSSVVGEVAGISSAAILGDGRVALIIDIQGLFKHLNQQQISHRNT